jgi:uncharacterized protein YdeI (YjbR/CyaY-like superfamily)
MARPADKAEPILTFISVARLEAHMSGEPKSSKGFWLKLSKAGAAKTTISKADAIEAGLCCGWIDGQLAPLDEEYFLVRMTPRRPGSRWSAKNRATADRLMAQGRVRPAGRAEIEAAKGDGRWEVAYASQGKAEVPADLAAALALHRSARRFFEMLDRANRYAIIYRVNDARRPETRAQRIAKFVDMCARGEVIHPARRSKKTARSKEG